MIDKPSYHVYKTTSYTYLRIVLFFAPILCIWEAYSMQQSWLYVFCGIMIFVEIYVLSLINCKLSINENGVTLTRPLHRSMHMPWDDMKHIGMVSISFLGNHTANQIFFFSKKRVNVFNLSRSKYLPKLSSDFLFLFQQPHIRDSVDLYLPKEKYGIVDWKR